MFEKAIVEEVLLSSREKTKKQQFLDYNKIKYDSIVLEIENQLKYSDEYKNFSPDTRNTILEKVVGRFFEKLPDNTLIVTIINKIKSEASKTIFCYPFFSSHFMMPVKPGEVVWIFNYGEEENERKGKSINQQNWNFFEKRYWISRVHGESFNEDLNYTHHDRGFLPEIPESFSGSFEIPSYEDSDYSTSIKNDTGDEIKPIKKLDLFNSFALISGSIAAYNDFSFKPVPNINKKPGDLILQGSNNNSISLDSIGKDYSNISIVAGKSKILRRTLLILKFYFFFY